MQIDEQSSAFAQQMKRKVISSRSLDALSSNEGVSFKGAGCIEVSSEKDPNKSIKLICPNSLILPDNRLSDGIFGTSELTVALAGEDIAEFDRITLRCFADCPGHRHVSLELALLCEEEASHIVHLQNGKWTDIIWDISALPRSNATSFTIRYSLCGGERGAKENVTFYFNDLLLEKTERSIDERIAFCHIGYQPNGRKIAYTDICADEFKIVDANGSAVFTGKVQKQGEKYRLDFTPLSDLGEYRVSIGGAVSKPFAVSDAPWNSAIVKTLNYYRLSRCGYGVPGVHLPCHEDCFVEHPDTTLVEIGGGWHSGEDLSHSLFNTAGAASAFIRIAQAIIQSDKDLYMLLMQEARHGLEWMLRTRFCDGYRCVYAPIKVWTKGIIGDGDDIKQPAHNDPYANLCAAAAEGLAAGAFKALDATFADYSLRCAKEDFRFGYERLGLREKLYGMYSLTDRSQLYAKAITAAVTIYCACEDESYLKKATMLAKALTADMPLEPCGVTALALLIKHAPEHNDSKLWKDAMTEYAENACDIYVSDENIISALDAAKAASIAAAVLGNINMHRLAVDAIEQIFGCNPSCRSMMYGEGYNYLPVQSLYLDDAAGALVKGDSASYRLIDVLSDLI